MSVWLVLLAGGMLTFALKATIPLLSARTAVPDVLERAGPFVSPAMCAALAARAVVPGGSEAGDAGALAALVVAVLVTMRTRSVVGAVAAGVAVHTVVRVAA